MRMITNAEVMNQAAAIAFLLNPHTKIYGVPRGGIPAAFAVKSFGALIVVDDPQSADVIIDDIYDSGRTAARYAEQFPHTPFHVLFDKREPQWAGQWLVMPWEGSEVGSTEDIVVRMLQAIGEDPKREGLLDTPRRVNKAWKEWFSGYNADLDSIMTTFDGESYDEMVAVHNIPVFSCCEHHITPFFGIAHVGYIPNGRIVGISKLARVVDAYARRLQVQERLTRQVADCINSKLDAKGVAVIIRCRHMCMHSRGVKMPGTVTTTSAMLGVMNGSAARSEFMSLCDAAERNQT